MDREQMQRRLEVVGRYRAAGQKGKEWAGAGQWRTRAGAGKLVRPFAALAGAA